MALPSRTLFGSTRGAVRRRRPAEARVLGVEQLDRRQMLSANAMASFADTGHGLAYEIKSTLPKAEYVWTSALGKISPQVAKVQPAVQAAKPTVSLSNGVLTVTGTSGADTVEVRQNGDRIEIVGANVGQPLLKGRVAANPFTVQDGTVSLPASLVKQIKIDGGAGDDTIKVRTYEMSADVITKVSIDAGAGNDRVEVGVNGAMAKKVFADLGKGTDTLVLPAGVTLGTQKQAEQMDAVCGPQLYIHPVLGLYGRYGRGGVLRSGDIESLLEQRSSEVREFTSEGRTYRTVPGALAYRPQDLPADSTAWRSSVVRWFGDRGDGNVAWVILRDQPAELVPGKAFHVAVDSQGCLHVLTGSIGVFFDGERPNSSDDAALAEKYNLRRISTFPDIGYAVYQASEARDEDILRAVEAIRQEPGVAAVSPKMDSGNYPIPYPASCDAFPISVNPAATSGPLEWR